jgi:DNA polymerase
VVWGVGNPHADLMFIGEAPGRDEDINGEPFVGRAGQLLTDIIVKGMRLRREDVYIANIIKCRPPENRPPQDDEVAACSGFLLKQVEAIRPRVLVALGATAAQTLLQTTTPIGKLRGRFHEFHGVPLLATFHPSYLLRSPQYKKDAWEDLQKVMELLGLRPG